MQRLGDLHDFGVSDSLGLLIPGSALDWRQGRTKNVVGSAHVTNGNRIVPNPVVLHDPDELVLRNVIGPTVKYDCVGCFPYFSFL